METVEIKPISVTQLNEYIKDKFDDDENLKTIFIQGEISNYKRHFSGHLYFSLKDEKSVVSCVMFKRQTLSLDFEPKDGEKVIIMGRVSAYPTAGTYQIYANTMQRAGLGDLYQQFEELKKKLEKKGYFDETHKKKIPFMPRIIGVLTSNTGSVIKDIINVSTRRNPGVYIRLLPVPVQGQGAGEKIAKAIDFMNKYRLADVLIIGRGGGSLEDLWPFNEEVVADAIYNSEIPIISAVGHETDFTISDFVADLRAPTPSAAAELAVPRIEDIKKNIETHVNRNRQALLRKIENIKLRYKNINQKLEGPINKINEYRLKIDSEMLMMQKRIDIKIMDKKNKLDAVESKIKLVNPLSILDKGYVLVEKQGKILRGQNQLKKGDKIELRFNEMKKRTAEILD